MNHRRSKTNSGDTSRANFRNKMIYRRNILEEKICGTDRAFNVDIVKSRLPASCRSDFVYAGLA
jgi:hypothetical protein